MRLKVVASLLLVPCFGTAVPIGTSLTFDGLKNGEQILNYYSGGFGSLGSGPGPSYGVTFTAGLAADSTVIAFGPTAAVTASRVAMDLDSPFSQIVSFYFAGNGTVSFYSGPNATGSLLHSYTLTYPPFFPFSGVPGAFESAVFTPVGATLRLDSITFGAAVVPEPSVAMLVIMGIMLIALLAGRSITTYRGSTVFVAIIANADRLGMKK